MVVVSVTTILYQIKYSFISYFICLLQFTNKETENSYIVIKKQKQNLYMLIPVPNNCL